MLRDSMLLALVTLFVYTHTCVCVNAQPSEASEYRAYDSTGNNVANPNWGAVDHCNVFAFSGLSGQYPGDGSGSTIAGSSRPSARLISNEMSGAAGYKVSSRDNNAMHVYWGQMITVDVTETARVFGPSVQQVTVEVPEGDLWFDHDNTGTATMIFERSATCSGTGTSRNNPKLPQNHKSSFLDLDFVYGSSESDADAMRTGSGGEIVYTDTFQSFWQPVPNMGLWRVSGDIRTNKTPPLWFIHELFAKNHNRLAAQLAAQMPSWNDETLYQEARRRNIAVYQKISTREYLGALLGVPLSPYTGYDSAVNPGIDVFFSTASFRYGHAAVPTLMMRTDNKSQEIEEGHLLLRNSIYNPQDWSGAGGCPIFRGMMNNQKTKNVDTAFVDDVRNLMFGNPNGGSDLYMTNIMRGRDHGLATYNDARAAVGLDRVTSFSQITSNSAMASALQSLYGSVNSIDAYVGGLAEDHVSQSSVGQLFWTSIRDQFTRIRDGDRFWYENDQFTQTELDEIYRTNLTDLILLNYDSSLSLPPSSFFVDTRQLDDQTGSGFFDDTFVAEYDHTKLLSPTYRLSWTVSEGSGTMSLMIQCFTNGWAGIGFENDPNTMKGADIAIARFNPSTGEGEVVDYYAQDVGPPTPDTDLGGTDDIQITSVTRQDGLLIARFSRPLAATDSWDKPITDGEMPVIFAFNPDTNWLLYHGPTRSSAQQIDFYSTSFKAVSNGVRYAVAALWGFFMIILLSVWLTIFLKKDHFHYLSPLFCHLICFGTLMTYMFVILQVPSLVLTDTDGTFIETRDSICLAQVWLFGIGYMTVFGALFAKVGRIFVLFSRAQDLKRAKNARAITDGPLLGVVGVVVLVEGVFLAVWSGVDPPVVRSVSNFLGLLSGAEICAPSHIAWWAAFVAIKFLFLGVGVFLAIATRNLPSVFNESKQVSIAIYNTCAIGVLALILAYITRGLVNAMILIQALAVLLIMTSVLLSLFGKLMIDIWIRKKLPKLKTATRGDLTGSRSAVPYTDSRMDDSRTEDDSRLEEMSRVTPEPTTTPSADIPATNTSSASSSAF